MRPGLTPTVFQAPIPNMRSLRLIRLRYLKRSCTFLRFRPLQRYLPGKQANGPAVWTVRQVPAAFLATPPPTIGQRKATELSAKWRQQLRRVVEEIAAARQANGLTARKLAVVIRSTVFPGTCEDVVAPVFATDAAVTVVSHPEFLREGTAVKDFLVPSLTVVGSDSAEAAEAVASLYAPLGADVQRVTLRTAEMIKYACNAFHALKVGFANEIGSLSTSLQVDGAEVMATLCKDDRLNISTAYLRPGFAFGGSCLPKDLRALCYRASRMDLHLPLLESVLPSNDSHLRRATARVMEHPSSRIGIYGLAFKEDTDDLRESPVVSLIEYLIGKGRDLRIYDRHIQVDQIYGANRQFLVKAVPHIERHMAGFTDMMEWAEVIVIAQNPPAADRERLNAAGRPIIDLTVC